MRRIRVLIVDDSALVRRLVRCALETDPAIEVIGTAANGKIALERIKQLTPDAITLDIEMPEMNGLTALPLIRERYPRLPIIMFSTLTQRGATDTLDALSLGASDYVTKPSNVGNIAEGIQAVQEQLVPRIKSLCSSIVNPRPTVAPVHKTSTPATRPTRPQVVAIGVSTGGPNALAEVFRDLPAKLPVPIVMVQHMPPVFTRCLAERLSAISQLSVREAAGGEVLEPGMAYIAPGNFHMIVERRQGQKLLRLNQDPPENSCRPAVDVLFRSVAEVYGAGSLAVVLTGMGHDGRNGCESIRAAGGTVLAQDERTSVVWGMPGSVVNAGLAHQVLPLHEVATSIHRLTSPSILSTVSTSSRA